MGNDLPDVVSNRLKAMLHLLRRLPGHLTQLLPSRFHSVVVFGMAVGEMRSTDDGRHAEQQCKPRREHRAARRATVALENEHLSDPKEDSFL